MTMQKFLEERTGLKIVDHPHVSLPGEAVAAPAEPASSPVESASAPAPSLASAGVCSLTLFSHQLRFLNERYSFPSPLFLRIN